MYFQEKYSKRCIRVSADKTVKVRESFNGEAVLLTVLDDVSKCC